MFSFKTEKIIYFITSLAAWICHQAKMSPTLRQPASLNSRTWNDSSLDKGSEENVHHNRVECTLHRLHFCATYHLFYLKQKCCVWTNVLRKMCVSPWGGSLIHSLYITPVIQSSPLSMLCLITWQGMGNTRVLGAPCPDLRGTDMCPCPTWHVSLTPGHGSDGAWVT